GGGGEGGAGGGGAAGEEGLGGGGGVVARGGVGVLGGEPVVHGDDLGAGPPADLRGQAAAWTASPSTYTPPWKYKTTRRASIPSMVISAGGPGPRSRKENWGGVGGVRGQGGTLLLATHKLEGDGERAAPRAVSVQGR